MVFDITKTPLLLVLFVFFQSIEKLSSQDTTSNLNGEYVATTNKYSVNKILIIGNEKTKQALIFRELVFELNDSLSKNQLIFAIERSKQNLLNTSLFNEVSITPNFFENEKRIELLIQVKERWYFWLRPLFQIQDRNFNAWWENQDLFRLNYGAYVNIYNLKGGGENVKIATRKGYTDLVSIKYLDPFINRKQTLGFNFSIQYQTNREIPFATAENKQLFYRNYSEIARKEWESNLGLILRKRSYTRHFFDLLWRKAEVSDVITQLNPDYFFNSANEIQYFSLRYGFKYDFRDSKVFPHTGEVVEMYAEKMGLNLNGSGNMDELIASFSIKKYIPLANRIFLSSSLKIKHRFNPTSTYYLNSALGFQDYIKGYEYYVVDGQSFAFSKINLAYQLVRPSNFILKSSKARKFSTIPYAIYFSAHCDAGYVKDDIYYSNNPLSNTFLMGNGLSLTFVSYYDYVLRLDFSVNKFNEKGIFLHFNSPI